MTVKELISELFKCDPNAKVVLSIGNHDGCDTCGHGETFDEHEINCVSDLETRVVLDVD